MQDMKDTHYRAFFDRDGENIVQIEDHQLVGWTVHHESATAGDDFLFDDVFQAHEHYGSDEDGNDIITSVQLSYGLADHWTGHQANNSILEGLAGDDLLVGGVGNDVLKGGEGDDELYGDLFRAKVTYSIDDDGVHHPETYELVAEYDAQEGNDILQGGDGDDHLHSGDGMNFLDGGDGDDVLYSSGHHDVLRGGGGWDQFAISPFIAGEVRILDFTLAEDNILISKATPLAEMFILADAFDVEMELEWFATENDAGVTLQIGAGHTVVVDNASLDDFSITLTDDWLLVA